MAIGCERTTLAARAFSRTAMGTGDCTLSTAIISLASRNVAHSRVIRSIGGRLSTNGACVGLVLTPSISRRALRTVRVKLLRKSTESKDVGLALVKYGGVPSEKFLRFSVLGSVILPSIARVKRGTFLCYSKLRGMILNGLAGMCNGIEGGNVFSSYRAQFVSLILSGSRGIVGSNRTRNECY